MAGRFDGQVALVTGAARGLGLTYGQAFAREGAKVVLTDILDPSQSAEGLRRQGAQALGLRADVTQEGSMKGAVEETVRNFGRLDILINNAGIYAGLRRGSFLDISLEEWDRVMAVNVKGIFLSCRAAVPQMKRQGKGKIVNISSAVVFTGIPDFLHYTASKAAVVGMTRALARELGPSRINVNAVAPGYTMAPSNEPNPPQINEHNIRLRSIGRTETPEDLVGTVLFLSSSESDFLTGQTLVVDGGLFMH